MAELGPQVFQNTEDCVDALLERVGKKIVLGLPLGLGKANHFTNALYARAAADPSISLKIFTALTLERPVAKEDIQRRFLQPLLDRLYNHYQDLGYTPARHKNSLPANIEVCEFFLQTGSFLNNTSVQQDYVSSNYTHVPRDLIDRGVNVVAQMVAPANDGSSDLSLSSNPDLTLPLLELARRRSEKPLILIGEINPQLPFLEGDARIAETEFDYLLRGEIFDTPLFPAPSVPVRLTDYALAFHIASLISDGGTLQIGIGALGDAICHALILRHHKNSLFREISQDLNVDDKLELRKLLPLQLDKFSKGLYGASEMVPEGFLHLRNAGILVREVFPDAALQKLINSGKISNLVDEQLLLALHEVGRIQCPLTEKDTEFLQELGIVDPQYSWRGHRFMDQHGEQEECDLHSSVGRNKLLGSCAGKTLANGTWLHGGFYLGSNRLYQALRDLPVSEQAGINMTAIDYINQLQGQRDLKAAQRVQARFVNSAMMVTLTGAAISDGLADAQVVSGVGGQYNFVAQAHELEDGRSIIALPSTRISGGKVSSNIVWEYPQTTIPRHLRDIVVTEYGVANLRGKSDRDVIAALLCISDSRFQAQLMGSAKQAGKLDAKYQIPSEFVHNTPQRIASVFGRAERRKFFPYFPLGTDFTPEESRLAIALLELKQHGKNISTLIPLLLNGRRIFNDHSDGNREIHRCLKRMEMEQPQRFEDRLKSYLVAGALHKYLNAERPLTLEE